MLPTSTAPRVYVFEAGTAGNCVVRVSTDDCTLFATGKDVLEASLKRYNENTAGSPGEVVHEIVTEPPEEALLRGALS